MKYWELCICFYSDHSFISPFAMHSPYVRTSTLAAALHCREMRRRDTAMVRTFAIVSRSHGIVYAEMMLCRIVHRIKLWQLVRTAPLERANICIYVRVRH